MITKNQSAENPNFQIPNLERIPYENSILEEGIILSEA